MAYPASFSFQEFDNITSYAHKIKYATQHLQRLSSGSSRVIFKIDDEKVLKVAKNIKGLAQNNTEQDYYIQQWHSDIVAKVFKVGDEVKNVGPFYLEMELARKITPKRFQTILGISVDEIGKYLLHMSVLHGKRRYGYWDDNARVAELDEMEFVRELWEMIQNFNMAYPGDFSRINSYGEVLRDGEPTVVLVDFGLSHGVWMDYYAKN